MTVSSSPAHEFAAEISSGLVWQSPYFYLLVVAISLVSSVATAFLSAYFKRRGEALATKAAFDEILDQLRASTHASEDIRADIQARYGAAATARQVLREKTEAIIVATVDLDLWFEQARGKAIRGETPEVGGSPIGKISAWIELHFPEAKERFSELYETHSSYARWLLELQIAALENGGAALTGSEVLGRYGSVQAPLSESLVEFRSAVIAAARERGAL